MATLVGRTDAERVIDAGVSATAGASPIAGNVLVERARRGDRTAQAALFEQLQDVWFRFCISMLGNAESAREAVQETALRFLQQLGAFRGDSQLRTWSLGIALNVCREFARKNQRRPDSLQYTARRQTSEARPDSIAAEAEQHRRVRGLVDDLPPRQREAMILRYFEQLDTQQTAKVMACATGTVKATVAQALKSLRRRCENKP